jgi:hypothetical protein
VSRSRDLMTSLMVAAGVTAFVLVGCQDERENASPVEPVQADLAVSPQALLARRLACPSGEERSVRAEIGPNGGTVALGGHAVFFPPGAVREPVQVTLSVPASPHVELDVRVNGREHYRLARPVLVTMSYDRCGVLFPAGGRKTVWYYDRSTERLLEEMPTLDNPATRSVSFVTNHFSGWVIITG